MGSLLICGSLMVVAGGIVGCLDSLWVMNGKLRLDLACCSVILYEMACRFVKSYR